MRKLSLFIFFLAGVIFFAGSCVNVEQLDTEQNVPQIDQVPAAVESVTTTATVKDAVLGEASSTTATSTADTENDIQAGDEAEEASTAPGSASVDELEGTTEERYCKRYSGIYTQIHSMDEVWGACYFQDGSMCEIMSFMRGECNQGGCKEECRNQGTRSEGWYESCTGKLIRWANCSKD